MIDAASARTIADIRGDLVLLDQGVASLERDLTVAQREEQSFVDALGQLNSQIAELCVAYAVRIVESGEGCAAIGSDLPPEIAARIRELAAWRRDLVAGRERWLQQTGTRAATVEGWPIVKSLTPSDVTRRLTMARQARDGVRAELAQAVASAERELAAAAEPVPDVSSRLASIRARLGIG